MKTLSALFLIVPCYLCSVASLQRTEPLHQRRNLNRIQSAFLQSCPPDIPFRNAHSCRKSFLRLNVLQSPLENTRVERNSTITSWVPGYSRTRTLSYNDDVRITLRDDRVQADPSVAYVMMALIFTVASLSALDRVAMSVALVPMTEEMGFSDTMKGSISSLYSVGYALGILPCGVILAYASPRFLMAIGIALWSLGTIATPTAATQDGMIFLLCSRAMVGASESVVIPSVQRLLSNWIPPEKKSLALALLFSGFQMGTILAYTLSPIIIEQLGDWRDLFLVYGGAGLLFLIPWLVLARDSPTSQKNCDTKAGVAAKDLALFSSETSLLEQAKAYVASAPWQDFLKSKGVWGMFLAHAACNWGLYNSLSWAPTFYAEQYGLNVKESALLLVIPSIAACVCGVSAGFLADNVVSRLEVRTTEAVSNIRKVFQSIALFGPAICLATLATHIPEQPWMAQCLLTGSIGLQAFNAAGYGAANQEKAGEKWTGLLYSVTSLPSVWVGTFSTYLTGQILDFTNQDWTIVFGLNALICVLGGTAFVALYDSSKEFD